MRKPKQISINLWSFTVEWLACKMNKIINVANSTAVQKTPRSNSLIVLSPRSHINCCFKMLLSHKINYPRQHQSSGPPVAMSGKMPLVVHQWQAGGTRRVGFATDGHWWTTGGPPPAKNVAGGPPAISWTSVCWATTGNRLHSVVGHRRPTITLLSGIKV